MVNGLQYAMVNGLQYAMVNGLQYAMVNGLQYAVSQKLFYQNDTGVSRKQYILISFQSVTSLRCVMCLF